VGPGSRNLPSILRLVCRITAQTGSTSDKCPFLGV